MASAAATELGYTTTSQARNLRACMVCSIIQLQSRFLSHGCPNCESVLQLHNNIDSVLECTSANFHGMIAVTDPKASWVARWQRVDRYVPGMYAVQVIGSLSRAWVAELAEAGMRYVPRDGSRDEEEAGVDDI